MVLTIAATIPPHLLKSSSLGHIIRSKQCKTFVQLVEKIEFSSKKMNGLNKYLYMAILMTLVNIPLFIYSQSLGRGVSHEETPAQLAHEEAAPNAHSASHADPHAQAADASHEPAAESPAIAAAIAALEEEEAGRYKPLGDLYRPPLLGKCKKLFERFGRKHDPEKPFKAFVYSFDGENAYCADAYTSKGQRQAEEIALRDCDENQSHSGKYSPCRIYASEESK